MTRGERKAIKLAIEDLKQSLKTFGDNGNWSDIFKQWRVCQLYKISHLQEHLKHGKTNP